MSNSGEPREVGPIEGREVHRGPDPDALGPQPPATTTDPPSGGGLRGALTDIRSSRGKDVPNSRPLPPWVRRFAWVLDDAFPVPGTAGRRVGVDGLIAIVPVAGDVVGIGLAMVIIVVGIGAGVSLPTTLRMLLNVGFEALVGLVPFVGTVFNMVFKANNRNVALIEADLADRRGARRSSIWVLVLTVIAVLVGFLMVIVFTVLGLLVLVWLVTQLF